MIFDCIDITPLIKGTKQFNDGFASAKNELERDGVIQRFKVSFELVWKTLKRVLAFKGVDVNSPRDVFRESAKQQLIEDPLIWFDFIKKRNLTVHTYNQDCAEEIFESLSAFQKELDKVVETIKGL